MSMKKKGACCSPFLQARLGRDDTETLASAFKAIADPARLRLLSFIARQPAAEACVCHRVEALRHALTLPAATASMKRSA